MLSRQPSSPPPPNIPTLTETVLLLEALDSSPITSSHIRQWTVKDPTLAKVWYFIEHPDEDVVKPFYRFWPECLLNKDVYFEEVQMLFQRKVRNSSWRRTYRLYKNEGISSFIRAVAGNLVGAVKECSQC